MFVKPALIPNSAGDADLGQRDLMIDGVNGFDFIQLNGIPVLVNPESIIVANTEAATNLGFVDMSMGPDELSFLMTQHRNFLISRPEDVTVLQVNGVPVTVNPESFIIPNTEAATNLGFVAMTSGPDELSFIQRDLKNIDDDEMASALKGFNEDMAKINEKYAKGKK